MCDYQDTLTKKYKDFPDEANADAWAIQDACNLQAVAQTFMCMARAADFKYDNPAVLATLDKMNSLCHMQGTLYNTEVQKKLDASFDLCINAYNVRESVRMAERKMGGS